MTEQYHIEDKEQTFTSLKVLVEVNCAEIGKKTDGSAAGTTNSSDPLQSFQMFTLERVKYKQALMTVCFNQTNFNIS